MRTYLIPVIFISSVLLLGCTGDPTSQAGEAAATPSPAATAGEESPDAPVQTLDGKQGANYLWSGTSTVFGLRLPTGMKPVTPAPSNVYRYAGATPTEQALRIMKNQVLRYEVVEEEDAYLLRHAIARKPPRNQSRNNQPKLALRISKQEGGGSVVDIWLEHGFKEISRTTAARMRDHASGLSPNPPRAPETYKAARAKRIAETMQVYQKVQKGEPLTESDYNSPYFH